MIPYGKNKKLTKNYPDNHPQKGYVNWWEVELGGVDKGSERQRAKNDLRLEVNVIETDNFIEKMSYEFSRISGVPEELL